MDVTDAHTSSRSAEASRWSPESFDLKGPVFEENLPLKLIN